LSFIIAFDFVFRDCSSLDEEFASDYPVMAENAGLKDPFI